MTATAEKNEKKGENTAAEAGEKKVAARKKSSLKRSSHTIDGMDLGRFHGGGVEQVCSEENRPRNGGAVVKNTAGMAETADKGLGQEVICWPQESSGRGGEEVSDRTIPLRIEVTEKATKDQPIKIMECQECDVESIIGDMTADLIEEE